MIRKLLCALLASYCFTQLSCISVKASSPSNTGSPSINASAYPTLQAAIDAIPETGGTLVIDGQYEATATTTCSTITGELGPCIYLRSRIRILGDGVTSKIFTTGPATTALQIIASDLVTVSGIEFAGPWAPGMPGDRAVAVRIDIHAATASTRVTVEHCLVHNFPFDGLWSRNGTSQTHFLHNESFDNQWNGIEIEAQDASVLDNDLHDNAGQGIEIYSAAQRVRVASNRAERNLVGIKLVNDSTFGVLSGITLVGNDASHNLTGILYQSTSPSNPPSGSITITGNTAVGNQVDGIGAEYAGMGITISDNVVSSNASSDINISQTNDIVVSNNILTALPGAGRAINGIYIAPGSLRIHALNNATDGY